MQLSSWPQAGQSWLHLEEMKKKVLHSGSGLVILWSCNFWVFWLDSPLRWRVQDLQDREEKPWHPEDPHDVRKALLATWKILLLRTQVLCHHCSFQYSFSDKYYRIFAPQNSASSLSHPSIECPQKMCAITQRNCGAKPNCYQENIIFHFFSLFWVTKC